MRPGDDSQEGTEIETFQRYWEGDKIVEVPYQERVIKNLTGRTMVCIAKISDLIHSYVEQQESFSKMDRNWKRHYPNPPPGSSDMSNDPEKLRQRYPYHIYGDLYPSLYETKTSTNHLAKSSQREDYGNSATAETESSQTSNATPGNYSISHMEIDKKISDRFPVAADIDVCSPTKEMVVDRPSLDSIPLGLKEVNDTIIRSSASPPSMVSNAGTMRFPVRGSRCAFGHRPLSQVVNDRHTQWQEENQRLLRRQSAPSFLALDQQEDEEEHLVDLFHDGSSLTSSSNVAKGRTVKHKSSQPGLHLCNICNKSFTRNFDLQRHNQKHNVESQEDKARRTCPNCNRVLSRVDAAKRHVDTLPDSCNNNRKKDGLPLLDPMPQSHYDACKARYYKLAAETKKPKGRKKAKPIPF